MGNQLTTKKVKKQNYDQMKMKCSKKNWHDCANCILLGSSLEKMKLDEIEWSLPLLNPLKKLFGVEDNILQDQTFIQKKLLSNGFLWYKPNSQNPKYPGLSFSKPIANLTVPLNSIIIPPGITWFEVNESLNFYDQMLKPQAFIPTQVLELLEEPSKKFLQGSMTNCARYNKFIKACEPAFQAQKKWEEDFQKQIIVNYYHQESLKKTPKLLDWLSNHRKRIEKCVEDINNEILELEPYFELYKCYNSLYERYVNETLWKYKKPIHDTLQLIKDVETLEWEVKAAKYLIAHLDKTKYTIGGISVLDGNECTNSSLPTCIVEYIFQNNQTRILKSEDPLNAFYCIDNRTLPTLNIFMVCTQDTISKGSYHITFCCQYRPECIQG